MDPPPYYHLQNPSYFLPAALLDDDHSAIQIQDQEEDDPKEDRQHRERVPQWTQAETKELLAIRAELDASFTATKRSKSLWASVAARMQLKGFDRSPEQCKSKWKNLLTRFKGSEAMEGDGQFPFQEEMRSILSRRMESLLHFDDKGKGKGIMRENQTQEEGKTKRRRKGVGEVEEALREFAKKQMEMEVRWMEAAEAREAERRLREEEWRKEMVALQEERLEAERRRREAEEARWARQEARDERRHAVITAILTKIAEKASEL